MNILILSWRGPKHPNAGGAEQVTHEHAKNWIKAGHSVDLFTSSFPDAVERENIDGIEVIRRGSQALGVQIAAFFWYLFGKEKDYDLVIDQFHGIPFFSPLYIKTKKLAFIHEVAKEVWILNPWPSPLNIVPAAIGPLLEPQIFKRLYTKIPFLTVSESTKKELVEYGIHSKMINVIHNGVKVEGIKNIPNKATEKTAMFLGALSEDKGVKDAIRAFAEIERKSLNWKFWIIGKGEDSYVNELHKMAKDLKLGDKIKFWGFVNNKKKFELLAKAHFLINPSIREGWGLVNIEANAVKTPVLAYDVPGNRDSIRNNKTGILVEKGGYRDLAINAVKLINDAKRYEKMQEDAYRWSKRFDWKESTQKSLELIENL